MNSSSNEFNRGQGDFQSHRQQEISQTLHHSTMEQRFEWLEDMLGMLRGQMPRLLASRERSKDRQYPVK